MTTIAANTILRWCIMKPLLTISPCEHGNDLTMLELQEGCDFIDPNCRTKGGIMRYHLATQKLYALAPVRKDDGRFVCPWHEDNSGGQDVG